MGKKHSTPLMMKRIEKVEEKSKRKERKIKAVSIDTEAALYTNGDINNVFF